MPSSFKRKRTASDRSTSSKRRRLGPRRLFPRISTVTVAGRGPVAPRTVAKLKYNESFASNGTIFDTVFNLNSINDPNRTGAGHQPYGYDTYATLYNRYRVYKVDVVVQGASVSSTVGAAYKMTLVPNNTVAAYTDTSLAAESPDAYTKYVQAGTKTMFKMSYILPHITGATAVQYKADDRYQAAFGADPSEQICLHVCYASIGDTVVPNAVLGFTVTLIYHVEMFDPNNLAQS